MEQKYFTVKQATSALVLISPIVRDIILKRRKMIEIKKTIRSIKESNREDVESIIEELTTNLKNVSTDITYHLEELEMIGCYLKDFELGAIDFPSILNGRVVFLCWVYGEKEVSFWHELTKGLENKMPISKDFTKLELEETNKLVK